MSVVAVSRSTPVGVPPRGIVSRLVADRGGRVGLALVAVLIVAVSLVPLLLTAPDALDPAAQLVAPSVAHPAGTDQFGRDQLARILDGGRRSLEAAGLVLAASLTIGLGIGVLSGLVGGLLDTVAMRAVDVLLALPGLVLTLALIGVLGPSFGNLVLALVVSTWPGYARLARSCVLTARRRPDVVAARLAGIGWGRVALGHLLPGAAAQVLVVAAIDVGHTIIAVAGLSFLGLGVQPPDAEWGAMLADARAYLAQAPWLLAGPAAAILLAVGAATVTGEALHRVADPGSRR